MANKAISELPQAQNVNNQDLFVLEQSGIAKKLPAETFITEQGIINALATALDGHGGIQSVTLSGVSGRIRTYLITFTDGSATTFQVYDGATIDSIAKTSTAGLVDTYTIFMSDGTTSFFQVTNGGYGLDRTLTMSNAAAPADLVGDLKSAISETITKNLSPIANMTTTGGGNINASCGSVGHVEAGNQYTLSFVNGTTKTSQIKVRIIEDGTTTQTDITRKNLTTGDRFFVSFVATLTGNVVLNTALGSEYASTIVFTDIQLELGNVPTWYAKQDELTAVDKIVRNQMQSVTETLKDTAFESHVFSVAHQGGNIFGYPQNTLPNFIACAKAHWKYVELDVQWTLDNVPVISHDDTRTLYGTSTSISIASTTYSDLQNMQFFEDTSIKIPSLYDALDTCKLYGLIPMVEIKSNATTAQLTIIINYLKRKKLFDDAFLTCFQMGTLLSARSIDDKVNILLNITVTSTIDELIAADPRYTTMLNQSGKNVFAFSYTLLSGISDVKSHLAGFSDKGGYLDVYTIDTQELMTTYAPLCDYITSNTLRVEDVFS